MMCRNDRYFTATSETALLSRILYKVLYCTVASEILRNNVYCDVRYFAAMSENALLRQILHAVRYCTAASELFSVL
eukprot:10132186-Lingulodinium_polyedra.AAC.1